jgi:preprotein translocase subunit SecF
MEFFHKVTNIQFMATRKIWYAVSAVMIVASLVSMATRGLNLGTDFRGGMSAQVRFAAAVDTARVTTAVSTAGFAESTVTSFGSTRDILIRMPPQHGADNGTMEQQAATRDRLLQAVKTVDPSAEILQIEDVGPQVGDELRSSAWQSLAATMFLIFIYLLFRFHTWRLSLGAVVAALHDPIIVAGFFSWTRLTFDLPTVSALLAVIGYSLNDTVVVFDRIRERFHAARRLPSQQVLDQSINQTLSRTIITSGATFVVVLILLIMGGPVLTGFSTALVVGILVGTYSSIYIASAIALDCGLKAEHLLPSAVKHPVDDLP